MKCSVPGCNYRTSKPQLSSEKRLTFHLFPRDENKREIWCELIGRRDWKPHNRAVICSEHFSEDCFEPLAHYRKRRALKWDAVPQVARPGPHRIRSIASSKISIHKPPVKPKEPLKLQETAAYRRMLFERVFAKDHDYALPSPTRLKMDLERALAEYENMKQKYKVKNGLCYKLTVKCQRLTTECHRLKKIERDLEVNPPIHYGDFISPELCAIVRRMTKKKGGKITREKFPPELKTFALTLHYFSPRAYDYVRRKLLHCLPHHTTLPRWFANSSGEGQGLSQEALEILANELNEDAQFRKRGNGNLIPGTSVDPLADD